MTFWPFQFRSEGNAKGTKVQRKWGTPQRVPNPITRKSNKTHQLKLFLTTQQAIFTLIGNNTTLIQKKHKTQNMNNTTTSNPKKQCLSVVKEEVVVDGGGGGGKWESLNPEILALIFTRLSAEERVGVLPVVCKSFAACVHGPYCWAEIDIDQWCRKMDRTGFQVDSAVRKLVRRTRGTVRRLSAFKVGDPGFAYVANWYE